MSGFFFCGSIDEPVAYASSRRAKPNSSLVHSTHSSPRRERWMPIRARSNSASATWSRSLTASRLLSNGRANPSISAVKAGSRGSDEPASAPAPSGDTSRRAMVASRRSTSRASAQAWASRWWASSTGWARWRCV
jgi:hypothetical protein